MTLDCRLHSTNFFSCLYFCLVFLPLFLAHLRLPFCTFFSPSYRQLLFCSILYTFLAYPLFSASRLGSRCTLRPCRGALQPFCVPTLFLPFARTFMPAFVFACPFCSRLNSNAHQFWPRGSPHFHPLPADARRFKQPVDAEKQTPSQAEGASDSWGL